MLGLQPPASGLRFGLTMNEIKTGEPFYMVTAGYQHTPQNVASPLVRYSLGCQTGNSEGLTYRRLKVYYPLQEPTTVEKISLACRLRCDTVELEEPVQGVLRLVPGSWNRNVCTAFGFLGGNGNNPNLHPFTQHWLA
jgi:hypothetical protein